MASIYRIDPIQPLKPSTEGAFPAAGTEVGQPSMFTQIFNSMVDNVKQTEAARNEAYYALVTGQLDNPAQATIAATQATIATELLVQMRNRALDAYNELMRISL